MMQRTTLAQLVADPKSTAPAIITESPPVVLSYRALAEQIERLAEQLRSAGLGPGDCVVMVMPNGLEFQVWAAVVLKGDTDVERLQEFCRTRLADFEVPKVIRITSALPKNAMGKVERRDLAARFARQS